MTLMTGAMQLVVHEAAVQMTWSEVSLSSFTPTTTLSTDGSLTGAETTTRCTPHTSMYGLSAATVRNLPVQSITICTPMPFQSTCARTRQQGCALLRAMCAAGWHRAGACADEGPASVPVRVPVRVLACVKSSLSLKVIFWPSTVKWSSALSTFRGHVP